MNIYHIFSPTGELIKQMSAEGIYNYGTVQILRDENKDSVAVIPSNWGVIKVG